MSLQRGSLVQCNNDFERERQYYHHPYPFAGDLLVVRGLAQHLPSGQMLCTFEELVNKMPIPLAEANFDEMQTPEEGEAILTHVKKILTK